jgi:hypothetical protein
MDQKKITRWRIIRLILWALAMCVSGLIVANYSPRRAMFVPCFFLIIMVPAVLLPLDKTADTKQKV